MTTKNKRVLQKFAYREEFKGDTEHSTAAYIDIREDASTGSTSKLLLEAKIEKKANNCDVIKDKLNNYLVTVQIGVENNAR
ncbi:MAG: palindromic element RPE1 domain-containing protein [Rickettsia endosymbiont of Ixodes ricinus]|nr:palindromic element RPE1 domain-containing protein [Rickettsia endosymbiont of Ixodes ricinus]